MEDAWKKVKKNKFALILLLTESQSVKSTYQKKKNKSNANRRETCQSKK